MEDAGVTDFKTITNLIRDEKRLSSEIEDVEKDLKQVGMAIESAKAIQEVLSDTIKSLKAERNDKIEAIQKSLAAVGDFTTAQEREQAIASIDEAIEEIFETLKKKLAD